VAKALAGFSNTGVATVAVLFVVAKAVEESKALNLVIKYILRKPTNVLVAQVRLLLPVAFFSAFLNNTPIVAMMIPVCCSLRALAHRVLVLADIVSACSMVVVGGRELERKVQTSTITIVDAVEFRCNSRRNLLDHRYQVHSIELLILCAASDLVSYRTAVVVVVVIVVVVVVVVVNIVVVVAPM
jgi:hypothetical protein